MAALRLRWRQSYKAGRIIAQPAATGSQLQAARRAVSTQGPAAVEHVVTVAPAVVATAAPEEIMEAIRLLIASRGLALQEIADGQATAPGQWQPLPSASGGGPSGKMRLHLSAPEEVELIRDLLHDKAFQSGSDMVSLTVQDADFRPRRARRRAGSPAAASNSA